MSYPSITIHGGSGELPYKDGRYEVNEYTKGLHVKLTAPWTSGVGIIHSEANTVTKLSPVKPGDYTDWHLPSKHERDYGFSGDSGDVKFVLLNKKQLPTDGVPPVLLHIIPPQIGDEQYTEMLTSIGLLALSVETYVNAPVSASTSEPWTGGSPGMAIGGIRHHVFYAYRLLQLFGVIERNLSTIRRRPIKSIRVGPTATRLPMPITSAKALIKRAMDPSARTILSLARVESSDCLENSYIRSVIDRCSWLARGLAELLYSARSTPPYSQVPTFYIGRNASQTATEMNKGASSEVKQLNAAMGADFDRIDDLRSELLEWSRWGFDALSLTPFCDVTSPTATPPVTRRLTGTPGYSAIYHEFRAFEQTCGDLVSNGLNIYRLSMDRPVTKTWRIYEIWCFAKLYESFISVLRMRPPEHGRDILGALTIKNGFVELDTGDDGLPLIRQGTGSEEPEIKLRMVYDRYIRRIDTPGGQVKPDIRIDVDYDKEHARFCFDAKYKDYLRMDNGYNEWEKDVVGKACGYYLRGLGSKASFTLHPHRPSDYWGEVPFAEHARECYRRENELTEFVGHRYGGICFVPGEQAESQTRRVLSMMFGYHLNLYRLCTSCGRWLVRGDDTRLDWKSRLPEEEMLRRSETNDSSSWTGAVYCRCPECHRFWVRSHCYGKRHRILKTGSASIHRQSSKYDADTWMYVCPECGSDPSPADIRAMRINHDDPYDITCDSQDSAPPW